ncbi:MAG: hypothetical protein GXO50_04045 [Chlorobi bacterium]|nr:hypothetical protein [Chlorobiota bacterium]
MTKQLTVFLIFTTFATLLQAQDIDFFHKNQNDKFKFEDINTQMSMDEYRILSRELRMKDMMYAAIVPGYVHFYAKDNKKGYTLLALRTAAFGELAYMGIKGNIDFGLDNFLDIRDNSPDTDVILTYGAFAVIFGTYLYDWIHGQHVLRKKQENIRYKYNMKMNLGMLDNPNGTSIPAFSLSLQF